MLWPVATAIQTLPSSFVVLDTETTGLSARYCELVEVAAIRFDWDGQVLDRYETLIDPCCSIPYSATAVHGITDDMVQGKPTVREAVPALFDFLEAEPSVLLIHNAGFDLSFLRTAATRVGVLCPQCPVICTLNLARRRLKEMPRHRLDMLVRSLLGGSGADHRAGGDAEALQQIFFHMLAREPVISSMAELFAVTKVRSLREEKAKPTRRTITRENAQV